MSNLAVLYADVSGSTRLYEEHGDDIARADMAACIELLDQAAKDLGGETIKTIGDEIMCAFEEPVKAALAATEMQAALRRAGEEGHFQMGVLHIKVGWHYGAVSWRGEDLIGEAPVTAQQIINLANADEILTSRQSIDTLPRPLFPDAHSMHHIEAEAWDGEIEVYKMPWEKTGEETQISSKPIVQSVDVEVALILEYDGQEFKVDADRTTCIVGRGKNADLRVSGGFTSRQHAQISYRQGRFSVRDESVNGTYVVGDDGQTRHLRREEGVLTGTGMIGFGADPEKDPKGGVHFQRKG